MQRIQKAPEENNDRCLMKSCKDRLGLAWNTAFVGVYSTAGLCLTFGPDGAVWAWWYFGIRSQQRREARLRCERGCDGDAYDGYSH